MGARVTATAWALTLPACSKITMTFIASSAKVQTLTTSTRVDSLCHTRGSTSKFTHGELPLRNVILSKGKVAAIIDWDCAGWRAEYWEFTKVDFYSLGTPTEWIRVSNV